MTNYSNQETYADLQKKADLALKQLAELKKQIEQPKRIEAARRLVIQKTYLSTAQAAQKVGMPVTSFKRFVEKFGLRHSATLDGLPCYSPDWIKAFNSNLNAIEIGHESLTRLGRKEGKNLLERGRREINRFAVASAADAIGATGTKDGTQGKSGSVRPIMGRKNGEWTVKELPDGARYYFDEKGHQVAATIPTRISSTDKVKAAQEANLRRHEESRKRFEADQEQRRQIEVAKIKGLTPVATFNIGK